jgi:anti-anti-sigma factor
MRDLSGDEHPLRVDVDAGIIALSGELAIDTAPHLEAVLGRLNGGAERLDLTGVTFLDAAGLRVLLRAKAQRPGLVIGPVSRRVARVAALTGLDDALFDASDVAC